MPPYRTPFTLVLSVLALSVDHARAEDRELAVVNSTPVPVYVTLLSTNSAAGGFSRHSAKKLERHSNSFWKFEAKKGGRLAHKGTPIRAESATFVVRLHAYDRCDTYREYTVSEPTRDRLIFEVTPEIIADTYESLVNDLHGVCRTELGSFGYGPQLAPYIVESRVMAASNAWPAIVSSFADSSSARADKARTMLRLSAYLVPPQDFDFIFRAAEERGRTSKSATSVEKLFGTADRETAHRIRTETFLACAAEFGQRWARHVRLYRSNGGFTPAKSNYFEKLMNGWEEYGRKSR